MFYKPLPRHYNWGNGVFMDIFSFITLFGGLAFFLYGMHLLSESLKKTAGGKSEKLLKKATDNPYKGLNIVRYIYEDGSMSTEKQYME